MRRKYGLSSSRDMFDVM